MSKYDGPNGNLLRFIMLIWYFVSRWLIVVLVLSFFSAIITGLISFVRWDLSIFDELYDPEALRGVFLFTVFIALIIRGLEIMDGKQEES